MGVFWLAENMRWGPLIGCEYDSASFPWFPWMACQNEPQSPAHSPPPSTFDRSICLCPLLWSECTHVVHVGGEIVCAECVCMCVTKMRGGGSGVLACREKSSHHPTCIRSLLLLEMYLLVKTWPDLSPSPSPAEHAGLWVLSNAGYHKTDCNWFSINGKGLWKRSSPQSKGACWPIKTMRC